MNTLGKRIASVFVAGTLVLGGLVGCGQAATEPTSAKEVFEAYNANENKDNCHMDADLDISVAASGFTMGITGTYSADMASGASHADFEMSMLGQDVKTEMYVATEGEKTNVYSGTKIGDEVVWTKTETDTAQIKDAITKVDDLEGAEFAKNDTGYTVTTTADKLLDLLNSLPEDQNPLAAIGADDAAKMQDMLKNIKIEYVFDKECLLTAANITGSITQEVGEGDSKTTMDIVVDVKSAFNSYGEIDATLLAVPEDVKAEADKAAADAEELEGAINDLAGILGEDNATVAEENITADAA